MITTDSLMEPTVVTPQLTLQEMPPVKPRPRVKRALGRYEEFLTPWLGCWILGNAAAYAMPEPLAWPVAASLLLILSGIVFYTARPAVVRSALLLVGLLLGILCFQGLSFQPDEQDVMRWAPLPKATVQGVVLEQWPDKQQAVLAVRRVNGESASGRVLLDDAPELSLSGTVQLTGELKEPFHSPVPGTFNQQRYLWDQHITAVLKRPADISVLDASPANWQGAFLRNIAEVRNRIVGLLSSRLPSPEAEIVGGIVLGHHAVPLAQETKQQFVQTGLIHILAASGLNVGIIAGAVLGLMAWLRAGLTARLIVAMVAVAVYAVMTGLPPSIQRAAAMLELALVLKLINRRLSSLSLLLIATSMLLLLNPNHIGSLGFQFSVLTTLGLITMVAPLQEFFGRYITRWAAGLILVPLIAQLWVLPLSLFHFNQLPLHSVPLNIVAILLVTPLTLLGFTVGALALVSEWLAGWLAILTLPFAKGLLWLVQWGGNMDWAQWSLPSPQPWVVAALYGLLLLSAWLLQKNHPLSPMRRAAIVSVVIFLVSAGIVYQRAQAWEQTVVTAIPLSESRQAFLMKSARSNQTMLAMPDALGYWEGRTVADYLRHRNIRHLAALILWPSRTTFAPSLESGSDSAGLRVVQMDRAIDQVVRLSAGLSPEAGLAAGQRVRLGNVAFGRPDDTSLFRLETEALCLEGRTAPQSIRSACLQYIERTKDASYRPALFLGKTEPVFYQMVSSGSAPLSLRPITD